MSIGTLATVLSVLFIVSLIALAGELLYVLWRHRSFRHRSSPPPHIHRLEEPPNFTFTEAATKELLHFFSLKPHPPIELGPTLPANKIKDGSSTANDQVVDVLKLLDAEGESKLVSTSTTNEDDKQEQVELKLDVDFLTEPIVENGECSDDGNMNTKTVFSTPCDSPMIFTPVGSPLRDFMDGGICLSGV